MIKYFLIVLIISVFSIGESSYCDEQEDELLGEIFLPIIPNDTAKRTFTDQGEETIIEKEVDLGSGLFAELRTTKQLMKFLAVDPLPLIDHFCRATGFLDPICNDSYTEMPKICGDKASFWEDLGEWAIDVSWQSIRLYRKNDEGLEYILPILGAVRFESDGFSTGTLINFDKNELSQPAFRELIHKRVRPVDIYENAIEDGLHCENDKTRFVAYVDKFGITKLGFRFCIMQDGMAFSRTIDLSEKLESNGGDFQLDLPYIQQNNIIIENIPKNHGNYSYAWTFYPSSEKNKWTKHKAYFKPSTISGSKLFEWERLKVVNKSSERPNELDIIQVSNDETMDSVEPKVNNLVKSNQSAFVHTQNFVSLLNESATHSGQTWKSQFPNCDPLLLFFSEADNVAKACVVKDSTGCSHPCSIVLGTKNKTRLIANDATTVIHEVAHWGTNDLRDSIGSGVSGGPIGRGDQLSILHDLADAFYEAFTLDNCLGQWASKECVRIINHNDRFKDSTTGDFTYQNGQIAARLLQVAHQTQLQCGIAGSVRHFVRLSRAAVLTQVAIESPTGTSEKRQRLKFTLNSLLGAYSHQFKASSDVELLTPISCSWLNENFCPTGIDCNC